MSKEWIVEKIEDFRTGGGFPTIARRFLQTAPMIVPLMAGGGLVAGDILPGLPDVINATSTTHVLWSKEYGPDWAVKAVGIGLAASVIESASYPFRIGSLIRNGELYDVPPLQNITTWMVEGVRRGVDHVRNFRQDFQAGGSWNEFRLNLPLVTLGGLGSASGGILLDNFVISSNYQPANPLLAAIIGGSIGLALGALGSAEVVANTSRERRREQESRISLEELTLRRDAHLQEEDTSEETNTS